MARKFKFLRLPEVIQKIGIRRTAIYDRIGRGEFPKGIKLSGGRAIVWIEADIEEWMEDQVQASKEAGAVG